MQKRAARRGVRALAFLLCLLMVVSLLPVMGANAAEGDVTAEGVKLSKSLTMETDGTYTITLEAYATGTVTSTTVTEPVPTDFVLVLDQSGSMADSIKSYTYTARNSQAYSYYSIGYSYSTYYYKDGDAYYEVQSDYVYSRGTYTYYLYYTNTKDNVTYYLSGSGVTTTRPTNVTNYNTTIWTGVLYTRTQQSTQTKLAALKTAVENFVTSVQNQKDLNGQPVDHRIAIVGFAQMGDGSKWDWEDNLNSELFIGSNQYNYSSSEISNQYKNALQQVTTTAGINNLKASIKALGAEGGTYPQLGFEMANNIFQAYRDKNDYQYTKVNGDKADRGTVVVMFTDGEPGAGGKVETETANATMQAAKTSKNTYNAKVFTIGVFSSSNSNLNDINTYMDAVSSNYQPTENQKPTMTNSGSKKPASDPTNYYAMADDSEALNNAFQSVSSSVNSSSTSCELDAESVLKDVISGNLDLPDGFTAKDNVSVSTAPCTGKDANGNPTFGAASAFSADVSINGKTVDVSGFDYSHNYVTGVAGTGNKLIVTITGLLPNQSGTGMPSNETTSGIYDGGNLVAQFEVPTFDVASRNVVLDFSMTANIATVGGVKGNERVSTHDYGNFTYGENNLTYKLKTRVADGHLVFDGIDSALYFGHAYGDNTAPNAWTKVNVIPANNVYFDDDLLTQTSDFNDGNYGYDKNVPPTTNTTSVQPENGENMAVRTFIFTGSRIDLYCTTADDTRTVTAAIYKASEYEANPNSEPIRMMAMNNRYQSGTLYNVPTLSFDMEARDTYTVVLYAGANANYQLDGIRVYNPGSADVDAMYDAGEQNATFQKVRDLLLNADDGKGSFGEINGKSGIVYVDDTSKIGTETTDIGTYQDIGPKNEVYLANDNAIAFKVDGYKNGMKVMVGLSTPEGKRGTVKLSADSNVAEKTINSTVDMYYEVTPNADGYVVIENTGTSLISITNVKVSGTADGAAATFSVDDGLLTYMASFNSLEVTEPDAEPDPTPDTTPNQTTISATINAIWNRVMNGIAKLFGRL